MVQYTSLTDKDDFLTQEPCYYPPNAIIKIPLISFGKYIFKCPLSPGHPFVICLFEAGPRQGPRVEFLLSHLCTLFICNLLPIPTFVFSKPSICWRNPVSKYSTSRIWLRASHGLANLFSSPCISCDTKIFWCIFIITTCVSSTIYQFPHWVPQVPLMIQSLVSVQIYHRGFYSSPG